MTEPDANSSCRLPTSFLPSHLPSDLIIRPVQPEDMNTVAKLVSQGMIMHFHKGNPTNYETLYAATMTDLEAYFDGGDPDGFSGFVAELSRNSDHTTSVQHTEGTGGPGDQESVTSSNSKIVGYLSCLSGRSHTGEPAETSIHKEIRDFYVLPDYGRKGVGLALLTAYINSSERGGRNCSLGVSVYSGEQYKEWAEADTFFDKQGFELINDGMFDRRRIKYFRDVIV